uniref:Uncharacterized protein n=1 Tax=Micrurus spixii TaxID=129469 RepID=A0A2D4N883_9SAUR
MTCRQGMLQTFLSEETGRGFYVFYSNDTNMKIWMIVLLKDDLWLTMFHPSNYCLINIACLTKLKNTHEPLRILISLLNNGLDLTERNNFLLLGFIPVNCRKVYIK